MSPLKNVGNRIKEERLRLKLNQTQAAEKVGVRREMWSRYEKGSTPGDAVADKLYKAGFDVDYIFTGIRSAQYEANVVHAEAVALTSDAERIAGMYAMLAPQSQALVMEMVSKLRLLEVVLKKGDEK